MPPFKNIQEPLDSIKTVTISHDVPTIGTIPVLKWPGPGRVLGAYLVAKYSSSGTNVLRVGLIQGGNVLSGIGTTVVAPTNNGTVIAGSAYQLAVSTQGPEIFAAGDWLCLNIPAGMTPNAGFDVTIDYHLDAF
jgi:hypothetical protein